MYEDYFHFAENPFSLTPDPKYFFSSREHEEAISHILFGIQERKGFIVISGEVGTGKTTLCRHVLAKLDPKVKTALIFNPNLTTLELLRTINQDFGLSGGGATKKELVDELNEFLLDALAKKGNALLIIDEAQNLPIECLEEIRMLSNLETPKEKLLQILLIGQPELRDKLQMKELRQLNQRVALRYHLDPLSLEETQGYIRHRLMTAGGPSDVSFSDKAIQKIHQASGGVPRLINMTCDKALLAAYVAETKIIDVRLAGQAVKELSDRPESGGRHSAVRTTTHGPVARWVGGIALAGLVAGGLVLAYPGAARFLGLPGLSPAERPGNFSLTSEANVPAFVFDEHNTYRVNSAWDSAPAAALSLLRRWGVARVGHTEDDFRALKDRNSDEWMQEQGFEVFRFPVDIQKVALLGYPVLLKISEGGIQGGLTPARWVVLSRIADDNATLLDPLVGERRISLEELRLASKGDAVLLWRPLSGIPLPFRESDKESVKNLQTMLIEKGFYIGEAEGRWDEGTARAVRFLQQKSGLPESGLPTTESQIVLSRIVLGDRVPSLSDGA